MSKAFVFMRDVITKYHPDFISSESLTEFGLKNSDLFDIEKLMDHCLAAVGGYNYVDEWGRDFDDDDNSDGKTVTVNNYRLTAEIASVENKIGSLRISLYNEPLNTVHFFYIPKDNVKEVVRKCYGKASHKLRIKARWSESKDHYNSLEYYRVKDFKTLATMSDLKFQDWKERSNEEKRRIRRLSWGWKDTSPLRDDLMVQQQVTTRWQHMVGVIMLNQTGRKPVKTVLPKFLDRWPTPEHYLASKPEEVIEVIRPLGFYNRREHAIRRMSNDYLTWDFKDATKLYGIGQYGSESYRIFYLGEHFEPQDKELRNYLGYPPKEKEMA